MHVIISNGPPFSGKDTFTKHLLKRFPHAVWMRFKDVLYKETHKDLFVHEGGEEITLDEWIQICNDTELKDTKLPWSLDRETILSWMQNPGLFSSMFTRTPRNVLIDKSEKEIKVEHGEGGVAVITAGYIKEIEDYQSKLIIFSDGGFNVEKGVLCEELGITEKDLTVVRIDADGCNFDNDSREYIKNPKFKLFNDKTEKFIELIDSEIVPYISDVKLAHIIGTLDEVVEFMEPFINKLNKYEPISFVCKKNQKHINVFDNIQDMDFIKKYVIDNDVSFFVFDVDNNFRAGVIRRKDKFEGGVFPARHLGEYIRSKSYISKKVDLNLHPDLSEEDQFKAMYKDKNTLTSNLLFNGVDDIRYHNDDIMYPHFIFENAIADVSEISSDHKTAVLKFDMSKITSKEVELIDSITPVFFGLSEKIDHLLGYIINNVPAIIEK